jgi:hypothetical protein
MLSLAEAVSNSGRVQGESVRLPRLQPVHRSARLPAPSRFIADPLPTLLLLPGFGGVFKLADLEFQERDFLLLPIYLVFCGLSFGFHSSGFRQRVTLNLFPPAATSVWRGAQCRSTHQPAL